MADKITDEMIEYVGILAKLQLSEIEKEKAKNVEPMSHIFPVTNVFREDKVENENQKDEILSNAPKKKDGCFQVPKTID